MSIRSLLLSSPSGCCHSIPGVFNGLSARVAGDCGFEALYVSGAAVSAAQGLPDVGIVGSEEFCRVIREIRRVTNMPVIADADTGFGEGEAIIKTVYEYFNSGATALHIEDQVFPKRCGHLDGKQLVPLEAMSLKISQAVQAARDCSKGEMIICARTDARGVTGFEDALSRASAYVKAGAEMIFPEGLETEAEFSAFASDIRKQFGSSKVYLLANMTEYGKSPMITRERLEEMGYDIVIHPVSTLRSAMGAVKSLLSSIKSNGRVTKEELGRMMTRQHLYEHLRYSPGTFWMYPSPCCETSEGRGRQRE